MKLARILSLAAAFLLAAGLLAGCSDSPEEGEVSFRSFSSFTLDGSTFTQKDIAAKDATVINFWGTFCSPCIQEMPDLAAFEKSLPDNVQLITICVDAQGNQETAQALLEQAGFEGITLVSGDENFDQIVQTVQAVPTTFFVDSQGLVGQAVVGAQPDLAEMYLDAINQVLKNSGKAEIHLAL